MSEAEAMSSQCLVGQEHPLLNNLILRNVFQYLRTKDLKKCRLVCKTWNVSTIPFIRNTSEVTIYGDNSRYSILGFVEDFRSNKLGIPFASFQLPSFSTTDGPGQEFLQLCGETIQSIQFNPFNDHVVFIEDVSELLRATPNLEVFRVPERLRSRSQEVVKLFPEHSKPKLKYLKKLIVEQEIPHERNKYCPTFLVELITAAENISTLMLDDVENFENDPGVTSTSLEVLSLIDKLGRETSIKELKISVSHKDDTELMEILCKLTAKLGGLKLKRFEYNPNGGDLECKWELSEQNYNVLLQFLTHCSDTVEYLSLDESGCVSFITFPKFLCLKELTMRLSNGFSSRFVNLNAIFPFLEELNIGYSFGSSCKEIYEFFPESDPCPSMKSFQPLRQMPFHINAFNQMLIVFPNLTELRIDIITRDGAEILTQICSRMIQLKYLGIRGTLARKDSWDSVLTGIPIHALDDLRDTVNKIPIELEGRVRREMILELRNQYSTLPSITNLTNLRWLSLYPNVPRREVDEAVGTSRPNTDLSGYLGFYSMRSLKYLFVNNSELTKTCCEILTKDMGLQTWAFRTPENKHIIPCRVDS